MSKTYQGETTDISMSKKNAKDSVYGQDSLRFSYEFDRQSTASSADDKQINFQFEDYSEFELKSNNQQKVNSPNDSFSISNPTRQIGIFNKYRQNQEFPQENSSTDIGHSFDQIFNNNNDKETITKKFLKKKQTEEDDSFNSSYKNLGTERNQTQMGKGLFSDTSSSSDKKQQDTKDDIFDKIVEKHNEQNQKQVTPNGGQSLSQNYTSFDPFRQSYLGSNVQMKESQKQLTKKQHSTSPLRKKPTIPNQVISPAAQVKMPKVNIKWTYGGNSNTEQEINSYRSIPLGNVNKIGSGKFLLDESKSSDTFDAIPVTNDWNDQNLQLHSNSSFYSIQSNESCQQKKSDVSLDRSFESLTLKDPEGKKISLNVGSESLIRNQQGIKKLSMPIFDEEQRVTPFLKKIRRMNSIYPNFNHPNINLEMESRFCNSLAGLFEDALKVLEQVVFKVLQKARQANFFPIQFTSIEFFTKSQWECQKQKQWGQINSTIKPKLNFVRSQIDQAKIMKALLNYREVIGYYKQKKLDLTTEQGIKGYFRVREKFWNLERNMRSISEDVYQLFPATDYPQFYYDYLSVLKSPLPSKNDTATIQYHKQILDVLISNQQRNQQLSISAVGQAVRIKIQRELKFLFPF